jgi:hypothetical protein
VHLRRRAHRQHPCAQDELQRRRHNRHRLPGSRLDRVGVGEGARHARSDVGAVPLHRAGQRQPRRAGIRTVHSQPGCEDRAESGPRADVRRRVVLMRRQHNASRRRQRSGAVVRRMLATIVAVVLVLAAEVAATFSATAARGPEPRNAATVRTRVSPPPYGGEPYLPQSSTAPTAARVAAVRFVRDYALWSNGRLAIPAEDATERVIRLLEQAESNDIRATGRRRRVGEIVGTSRDPTAACGAGPEELLRDGGDARGALAPGVPGRAPRFEDTARPLRQPFRARRPAAASARRRSSSCRRGG